MATAEELNRQLEDILARMDKAGRQLEALRRSPTESSSGKPGAGFLAGKE